MRTGPAVPGSHGETDASLFKCLLLTITKPSTNLPLWLEEVARLDKPGFLNAMTARPKSVYLKKHLTANVGNNVWMLLSNWVVLVCNAVFVCDSVFCTDTVCIVLYRPMMIHPMWPWCLFEKKGNKVHCAGGYRALKVTMLNVLDSSSCC